MRYLKAHWPHLLLTLVVSASSTAFALGISWAGLGSRLTTSERRLDEIETAHVAETRWQVQQHSTGIGAMQSDQRRLESDIALIHTRLGIIETKLDAIAETLRVGPASRAGHQP